MGFSLKSITSENEKRGLCTVLYGEGGCGKTTLCASIPNVDKALFMSCEDGLSVLGLEGVARTPLIDNWTDFQEQLEALALEDHDYKVIFIDTLDAAYEFLEAYVIKTFYGGDAEAAKSYGAKYNELRSEFGKVISAFKLMTRKGINVVPIIHSEVKKRRLPDTEEYDFYSLNLGGGKKGNASDMLYNFSDNTIFMRKDVMVKDGKGSGGSRVLQTQWEPAYLAKSRSDVPEKVAADPQYFEDNFLSL